MALQITQLPEWGESQGVRTLYALVKHATTEELLNIGIAAIYPMNQWMPGGALQSKALYQVVLCYEIEPGTRRFRELVTHGSVQPSLDGRHYTSVTRGGLTMPEAELMCICHMPVMDEVLLDQQAQGDWGSVDFAKQYILPERQQDKEINSHIAKDRKRKNRFMRGIFK
jgi:hypothetical protein